MFQLFTSQYEDVIVRFKRARLWSRTVQVGHKFLPKAVLLSSTYHFTSKHGKSQLVLQE